jgi:hypothetical protein
MTASRNVLLWAPRVLGVLLCVFIGMFALDAFSEGKGVKEALPDFAIHLVPSLLLLAVVVLSWRREWIGGVAFLGLAILYAVMVRGRLDWIIVISGPLVIVGLLFLWSWRHHKELHSQW